MDNRNDRKGLSEQEIKQVLRKWAGLAYLRKNAAAFCDGTKDAKAIKEIERMYRKVNHLLRRACEKGEGMSHEYMDKARRDGTVNFKNLDVNTQQIIKRSAETNLRIIQERLKRIDELKERVKTIAKRAALVGGAAVLAGSIWWASHNLGGNDKPIDTPQTTIEHSVSEESETEKDGIEQSQQQEVSADDYIADYNAQAAEQLYNILDLTSFFEWTNGTVEDRFGYVGTTDKMSVGVVCENPAVFAQTLNTTAKLFISKEPEEAKRILGPFYEEFLRQVRYDSKNPRAIFDVGNSNSDVATAERQKAAGFQNWLSENYDALAPRVAAMYNHPTGRQIQIDNLNVRLSDAEKLCDEWGLTTARAKQSFLDMIVLEGGIGQVKKFYGQSLNATKDLEIEEPDTLWESYYASKYDGKSPELVAAIKDYFLGLSPEAKLDQYRLNLAYDDCIQRELIGENTSTMRRQSVVLGREFRLIDGRLERGGNINGTFRATNNAVLDAPNLSMEHLIEQLAAKNFDVSQETLAQITQSDAFKFTKDNLTPNHGVDRGTERGQ